VSATTEANSTTEAASSSDVTETTESPATTTEVEGAGETATTDVVADATETAATPAAETIAPPADEGTPVAAQDSPISYPPRMERLIEILMRLANQSSAPDASLAA
jgi:hypothetical protein